jgi:hypothetical protein
LDSCPSFGGGRKLARQQQQQQQQQRRKKYPHQTEVGNVLRRGAAVGTLFFGWLALARNTSASFCKLQYMGK